MRRSSYNEGVLRSLRSLVLGGGASLTAFAQDEEISVSRNFLALHHQMLWCIMFQTQYVG